MATTERGASTRNGSNGTTGKAQAQRHADKQREKMQGKRDDAEGVAGWVADRAGQWEIDAFDASFIEKQKYFWNPLVDYWFRMEIEGWEKIPEPPVLLVGIHSGAPFVWDAWTVGLQWWRHFGDKRPLRGTAHDALMAAPGVGTYFRKMGVVPAAPDSMSAALAAGQDVALWPGGERDSLRPWTKRDEAVLAGRKGFVRLAIKTGVPIVPIATVGGPDSMPILTSGRRLAKWTQLDKLAGIKVMPLSLSAPWGISPAMLPEIPMPTKIRTAFQEPVELSDDPDKAGDDAYVDQKYDEVQDTIQDGMNTLARRRRFPLFG
jgi:1-acyl-sn-glycerol-3-phosphate acyltransferase